MNVRDIIRAEKEEITFGKWTDKKIQNKDFPLFSRYPLTRRWRWQIIQFKACEKSFRILAAYHTSVPEFTSILAEDIKPHNRVLLRWEFHGSHPGWHIHGRCVPINEIRKGVIKDTEEARIPTTHSFHRKKHLINPGFGIDDTTATAIICRNFRIKYQKDLIAAGAISWN